MGDFSRSLYWEEDEEYSEENWQQGAIDRAYSRYISQPDSPPSPPNPPYIPTPEDDPVHSPTRGHGQYLFQRSHTPTHYRRSYFDSLMYARRVGQRSAETTGQYRDQIFHLSQAALCRELENFSPRGTHSSKLLQCIFTVQSRWLMRVLHTPPPELDYRTLDTIPMDLQPYTDLLRSGYQPNYPFPSKPMEVPYDDSTISSGSTSTSTNRDFLPGFPVDNQPRPETPVNNSFGIKGQPTIIIDSTLPNPISESASTIPLDRTAYPSAMSSTTTKFDPLSLLSPIEKDCPRLHSAEEKDVRLFVASYNEYRRAGGNHYTINDLVSIEVRKNFRMSSITDPNTLKTDGEWLSFLVPILPKLTSILAFQPHFANIIVGI